MEIKWNKVAVKQLLQAIEYLEENELTDYAQKIENYYFKSQGSF